MTGGQRAGSRTVRGVVRGFCPGCARVRQSRWTKRVAGWIAGCGLALVFGALLPSLACARDGSVTSFDGTHIAYSFFPAANLQAGQRAPTVMIGPGWSSGRDQNPDSSSDGGTFGSVGIGPLRQAGYNVLTWDPRGFGDSGGTVEVDSPNFEGRDVQALIDFIASQPEAQLDSPGDPRIGMSGVSYGGGIQLVAAAIDSRIDAIVPTIAWHSLVTSLYKNQTAKGGWGSALFGLGVQGSTAGGLAGGPNGAQPPRQMDPHVTDAFVNGAATGTFPSDDVDFFASRGPGDLVKNIHAPTLLVQGTADTLFTLQEAIQNYTLLAQDQVPVHMLWFCGGHGVCLTNNGGDPLLIQNATLDWFDRYLKGNQARDTGPGFSWISDDGVLRSAPSYPPAAGRPLTGSGIGTLPLAVGDNSGALFAASPAANAVNIALDKPAKPTELFGAPSLTLTYSGTGAPVDDRIYAQLVNDQTHVVLGNQVTPIKVLLDGASHTVTVPLEAVAIHAQPGSSYTLQLTDGSNVYFSQRSAGAINFSQVAVSVPTLSPQASK